MTANTLDLTELGKCGMPEAKKREPVVPKKVKAAVEYLLEHPADLQAAAAHVGMTTYKLREYLKKPHVLRYARVEKQMAIEVLCVGNPAALAEIRDRSENDMARVAAIKTAEALRTVGAEETGIIPAAVTPGLQIVIVRPATGEVMQTIGPPQRQIEGEQLRERVP